MLASETAYEIDPAVLASTFRSLRETGEELVAIVHSHPRGPAEPSKRDLERAYYPRAAHVIVSLAAPESPVVKAFRIIDGQAYEIEIRAIL
jgi:proteasome lid subunit RPN8/RPN11